MFEGLIGTAEFNFRHDQRRIVAIELIHLEEALAGRNDITGLVDEAALTKCHQVPGVLQRDSLFPLETADSVQGGAFDGQEALFSSDPHADRPPGFMGDIPLGNPITADRFLLESVRHHPEFAFGFDMHHYISQD